MALRLGMARTVPGSYHYTFDWKTVPAPNGALLSPIRVVIYKGNPGPPWAPISEIKSGENPTLDYVAECIADRSQCRDYLVTAWVGDEQLKMVSVEGSVDFESHNGLELCEYMDRNHGRAAQQLAQIDYQQVVKYDSHDSSLMLD